MTINPIQRQALLSFGSLLAVTGFGYIATFYFAHFLGPAVLGAYFLFLAYYGIFDLIGDGGLGGAAVKRISEGKEQNEFFTAFFIMRMVLLCLSIAVFIIFSPYLAGLENNGLIYWLIIALIAGTLASVAGTNLYGTAQVGIMQVSNLFNTIAKNLVQILAVFVGCSVGGLVAGFIAGMIVAIVIDLKFIRLSLTHCNLSHFKGLFSFSIWTFLSSGGLLIFNYADTILIGLLMTEADVGIYRVAFQLTSAASFLVTAFHVVLYPRISNWHAEKQFHLIEYALARAITYSLFLAIPVIAGGIILSDKLLYFFYGAAFESGAPILIILLFVQVANIFMYLQTTCLNAMDMPRISFYITAASAIMNIILNILLIPVWGISGAAIAMLVTMSMNAVLAYGILRSSLHVRVDLRSVINLIISAFIMVAFLLAYTTVLPVQTFIGLILVLAFSAVIYFCAVLGIDRTIRNDLKELLVTMHLPGIP
ncbi:flippase [Methanoregula sp.]|uniref:flippase n=1 Tax=Methanoregula sp. TaxID=2052170 RepID=UPI0023706AB3|nr:flippase [Methanoregula sp.]MDD1687197.1 flippase [Methanoregula sp.]